MATKVVNCSASFIFLRMTLKIRLAISTIQTCVFIREKVAQLKILFDLFKEELNLPAVLIK
jgi:hypothetical protein